MTNNKSISLAALSSGGQSYKTNLVEKDLISLKFLANELLQFWLQYCIVTVRTKLKKNIVMEFRTNLLNFYFIGLAPVEIQTYSIKTKSGKIFFVLFHLRKNKHLRVHESTQKMILNRSVSNKQRKEVGLLQQF